MLREPLKRHSGGWLLGFSNHLLQAAQCVASEVDRWAWAGIETIPTDAAAVHACGIDYDASVILHFGVPFILSELINRNHGWFVTILTVPLVGLND
jgi:hypothetical protein